VVIRKSGVYRVALDSAQFSLDGLWVLAQIKNCLHHDAAAFNTVEYAERKVPDQSTNSITRPALPVTVLSPLTTALPARDRVDTPPSVPAIRPQSLAAGDRPVPAKAVARVRRLTPIFRGA
jgi:hypothetical protein